MKSKSSKNSRDQVLVLDVISASKVEALLQDFANVGRGAADPAAAYQRLSNRYREIIPEGQGKNRPGVLSWERLFGDLLRHAWDAHTLRSREWFLHDAETYRRQLAGRFGDPPARATPLEAAIYHFRRNLDRALHCPNPECAAPYFFSTKKGQKYCSDVCALPAQRESKRRWWNENKAKQKGKVTV